MQITVQIEETRRHTVSAPPPRYAIIKLPRATCTHPPHAQFPYHLHLRTTYPDRYSLLLNSNDDVILPLVPCWRFLFECVHGLPVGRV